jgi:putative Mg2+ transporter-C (MgtC) family protein
MDTQVIFSDIGKLLLAAVVGGAIGFEREAHGQAAGFRTYLIVGVASCLMMMLSLHMEELFRAVPVDRSVVRLDPGRIASYAIASMGFLGAGAIIKGKGSVRGLTTAAGLWSVTGIGLSIGAGYIYTAVITTFIILTSLYLAYPVKALSHRRIYTVLSVKAITSEGLLVRIKEILGEYQDLSLQFVNYHRDIPANTVAYRIRLHHSDESLKHWSDIVKRLSAMPDMKEVTWEESDVP